MDLLLWRHAEAVDGSPDHTRELTPRGLKQARRMATLAGRTTSPRSSRCWSARRCAPARPRPPSPTSSRSSAASAPDGNVADILAATGWPDASGAALVVGHQPALGRLCALLLSGSEADWTIKKGALWWFTNRVREGETQTVLRAVIPSELA